MKLSDKLEVFVPTHIINADSNPYIKNEMIEQTIRSCHEMLSLGDVQFTICPDARFIKTHPALMKEYEEYLNKMALRLAQDGINCVLKKENGETLRGNWIKFVNECKKPYMFFLEHDWKFIRDLDTGSIIEALDFHKSVNYLRLSRFDINESYIGSMCSAKNWDWICSPIDTSQTRMPLTRISFFSGNPHFARVDFCKNFMIPNLEKYTPLEKAKGKSHLEKDLKNAIMSMIDADRDCGKIKEWGHKWPLSQGHSIGKGCPKCANAIINQHNLWGTFLLGVTGEKAYAGHLGDWCAKC